MSRKTRILLDWIIAITVTFGSALFIEFSGLQNKWVVAFIVLLVGAIFMSIFWQPIDYCFRPKIQKKDK